MYSQYITCFLQQASGLLYVVACQDNDFSVIKIEIPSVSCYSSIPIPPAYFLNRGEIAHCYASITIYNTLTVAYSEQ